MEKFRLGKTDMLVSRIGFGGIPIQSVNHDQAVNTVQYAFHQGINFFDTGRRYTTSEERIGQALKPQRKEVFLATKAHLNPVDILEKDFYESLNRLDTDYVDLFQFHNVTDEDKLYKLLSRKGGVVAFLKKQQSAGRLRYIGITTHRPSLLLKVLDLDLFDTIQFPFNYIENEPLLKLIPRAKEAGVGIIAMKPLAGGVFQNNTAALRWLLQWKEVIPIPGMASQEEVDQNIAALKGKLSSGELKQLEEDKNTLSTKFCRRCGYCMPCPNGIDVTFVVRAKQNFQRHGWQKLKQEQVEKFKKGLECNGCGTCESRCPYHLPLTELVKKESKELLAICRSLGRL